MGLSRQLKRVRVALLTAALIALGGCGAAAPSSPPTPARPAEPMSVQRSTTVAQPSAAQAPTRGLARPVPQQTAGLTIYLPRLFEDGSLGLRAVARPVALPNDPARDAIDALIRGPTGPERADDFEFALDARTRLRAVDVESGTATVDFEAGLDRVRGRPFSELVYWSIVYTLTEPPGVNRVALAQRGEPLRALGYPPVPIPASASRNDVPDWARPR